MKYKLVMFDFDGTLADSLPWFMSKLNILAGQYQFRTVQPAEMEALRGYDAKQIMKRLGIPFWKIPMIATHVRALLAQDIHQISLFQGVEQLLHRLVKEGVQLALVTSNSEANVRHVLGPVNAALIRYYECGVSIFGKPAKIRNILRKSGISHRQAMLIGDEIRDAEAARRAQIAFGAATWGYNSVESLKAQAPNYLFACVDDIYKHIL
ncbi:MAG: phosphoglycolate phosphatase [Herpetosiphonaceae bacterium]|nr:MAG: phosphoglycolate phosphatase [Herpetosiphonaceae bacterium]